MLLRGEPGIGKTTLWQAGVRAALGAGVRVLSARCDESEIPIAACTIADLLSDALDDVAAALPAPQRDALAAALGRRPAGAANVLPLALLEALRLLAADRPVLIAIDDAQWLDPTSRGALAFALRRLGDAPIAVLATTLAGDPLRLEGAVELDLGGLSVGALGHVLRATVAPGLSRPAVRRIHAASGGNPMFARELARSGDPRSLPPTLQALVGERVAALGAELRPVLERAAVLDRPTVAALRRLLPDADAQLDAAVVSGALAIDAEGTIRFDHPLLAAAVRAGLGPHRLRTLHDELADAVDDPEARLRHRALAADGCDPGLAAEMAAAAVAAGTVDTAATLAGLAARLSGDPAHALLHACFRAEAGELDHGTVDALLARLPGGPSRARALHLRHLLEPSADTLAEAIEHAGADPVLRAAIAGDAPAGLPGEPSPALVRGRALAVAGELGAARAVLSDEVERAEARGAELARLAALRDLAWVELRAGRWAQAEWHLTEAEDPALTALLLAQRGELEHAEAAGRAAPQRCRWALGLVELSRGEPARAWDHLGGTVDTPAMAPDVVEALALLGRLDEARAVVATLDAGPAAERCRALVALADGDADTAAAAATAAAADLADVPFDRARTLLIAGEAHRRAGRRRQAAVQLDAAAEAFAALGSPVWLERTRREHRRAAPRPGAGDELTAAEGRVVELVVAGRKNREIAAELFTTLSTVEAHLTRSYRKLGVRSRTELVRKIGVTQDAGAGAAT